MTIKSDTRGAIIRISLYAGTAAAAYLFASPAYAASEVTFDPTSVTLPANAPSGQTRPVQLPATGVAFGSPDNMRAYVYNSVSPTGASGLFDGVTGFQWAQGTPAPNQARVDYFAPNPATPVNNNGFDYSDLSLRFRPFYLTGSCAVCGIDYTVARVDTTGTGAVRNLGASFSNTIQSALTPISFGTSGISGTLKFTAISSGISGDITSNGSFYLTANGTSAVPGPLSILGATTAFSFSRKLRRRVQLSKSQEC